MVLTRQGRKRLVNAISRKAANVAAGYAVKGAAKLARYGLKRAYSSIRGSRKRTRRRRKRVRMSKSLTNKEFNRKVNNIINKVHDKSTYRKDVMGECDVGSVLDFGSVPLNYAAYFDSFKKVDNTAPFTSSACRFNFFNYLKLVDAFSVVYNGKSKSFDTDIVVGNFDTNFKGKVLYASAEVKFTNHCSVALDFKLHEFTQKQNVDVKPMSQISAAMLNNSPGAPAYTAYDGYMNVEGAVKLSDFPTQTYSRKTYNWGTVLPGEQRKWSKSIKDFVVDKRLLSEFHQGQKYSKGSVSLILEVRVRGGTVTDTTAGKSTFQRAVDYAYNYYVGCETKEFYEIEQPDEVDDAYEGNHKHFYTDTDSRSMNINVIQQESVDPKNIHYYVGGYA